MSDKEELLAAYDELHSDIKPLNLSYLFTVLLVLIFVSIFAFPKIYIQEQIYFKSRNIAKLENEYKSLDEENKDIKASVEYIKFKNQILDTLF